MRTMSTATEYSGDRNYRQRLTGTRNGHFIASYDDNSLSSQEFLGYNTTEATKQVVAAIDNPRLCQHHCLLQLQ